jgi:hypothetical protein
MKNFARRVNAGMRLLPRDGYNSATIGRSEEENKSPQSAGLAGIQKNSLAFWESVLYSPTRWSLLNGRAVDRNGPFTGPIDEPQLFQRSARCRANSRP